MDHIGLHDGGADVDERHRLVPVAGLVQLELVLDGERVQIHHRGVEPGLLDGRDVLEHLDLLGRDEHHGHGGRGLSDDLVVEEDLVDGERDVVLGLEEDGVRQLLDTHLGQRQPLHDRVAARDGDDGAGGGDPRLADAFPDRVGDHFRLADAALDDGIAGQGHEGVRPERVPAPTLDQLHHLDRAGPDVQPEGGRLLAKSEQRHARLPAFPARIRAFRARALSSDELSDSGGLSPASLY